MDKLRKFVIHRKNQPANSTEPLLKPVSYYVKGSFKVSGPAKVTDVHLSTLCLLVTSEAFIKRNYPIEVVNSVYTDMLNAAKISQIKSKHNFGSLNYWESHIEVKKFINIPCIPLAIELFNKRSNHVIRFLTSEEDVIQVEFNFFIATGDNSYLLLDCLLRQGYSQRKIKSLKPNPLLERVITSEHTQLNHNFTELASKVALAISAKTGTQLQIEWGR